MLRSLTIPLACAALAFAPAARAQLAGDYTIGGADPDFASFGAATAALVSQGVAGPVTFHVRAGTYVEDGGAAVVLDLPPVPGVSAANRVTFRPDAATGATVETVVLERSVGPTNPFSTLGYVADIDSNYVTLRELTLRNGNPPGSDYTSVALVWLDASNGDRTGVEILDCVLDPAGHSFFAFRTGGHRRLFQDLRIAGNRIRNVTSGIGLISGNGVRFHDAVIEGNHLSGMRFAGGSGGSVPPSDGIRVDGWSERLVIRGNVLDYAGSSGGSTGVMVAVRAVDLTIDGNHVIDVSAGGLYGRFDGIVVANDLYTTGRVVDNFVSVNTPRRGGIMAHGAGLLIAHNTVYLPERGIDGFGGSTALAACGSRQTVVGNVLVDLGSTAAFPLTICTGVEDSTHDGNLVYGHAVLVRNRNVNVTSVEALQSLFPSSVAKLPEIVDPHRDLHLAGCSGPDPELRSPPVDDPALARDIDGDARSPLAAAMGADQPPPETLAQPFGAAQLLSVGASPLARRVFDIAAADLDGGGDPDLLAALGDDTGAVGAIARLENLGGGAFAPPEPLPSLLPTRRVLVRAGDVDGDGAVDVVEAADDFAGGAPRLRIYWGVGDGSFTPSEPVLIPGVVTPTMPHPGAIWDLELGDVDGDGDLDIATLEAAEPAPLIGRNLLCYDDQRVFAGGGPNPADPALRYDLALGDLDGDGRADAVTDDRALQSVAGGCALADKGALPAPTLDTWALSPALAIADVDGDGNGDVLADLPDGGPLEDDLLVLRSDGASGFLPAEYVPVEAVFERRPGPFTTLDYDGDGDTDVFVGNRYPSPPDNLVPGTGVLLRNDGSGAFSRTLACGTSTLPTQPGKLLAADLDGDGREDVVALLYVDETIAWLRNASAGVTPIAIEAFAAALAGGSVALSWTTPAEENNAGFEVERRVGAGPWQRIGLVPGAGTTPEPQAYALVDDAPPASGEVGYRLRQVDVSGAVAAGPELTIPVPEPTGAALAALAALTAQALRRRRSR